MKQLTVGLMAHVDAGKTTLAEALLFRTGEPSAGFLRRHRHSRRVLFAEHLFLSEMPHLLTFFHPPCPYPINSR